MTNGIVFETRCRERGMHSVPSLLAGPPKLSSFVSFLILQMTQ